MILAQIEDWAAAAGAYGGDAPRLRALLRALDEGGAWEGVLDSEAPDWLLGVRYRGAEDHAAFLSRAGQRLGARWRGPAPAPGSPWLSLRWDARKDQPAGAQAFLGSGESFRLAAEDGAVTEHSAAPFSGALSRAKPIKDLLGPFSKLCPIAEVVTGFETAEGGRKPLARWSIRLAAPVPWPRFLGLDLSKPFTERATQLSYLALNRRVRELEFEGGRLTAYVSA